MVPIVGHPGEVIVLYSETSIRHIAHQVTSSAHALTTHSAICVRMCLATKSEFSNRSQTTEPKLLQLDDLQRMVICIIAQRSSLTALRALNSRSIEHGLLSIFVAYAGKLAYLDS